MKSTLTNPVLLSLAGVATLALAPAARADDDTLAARLIGYQEVPANSTPASGSFRATIDPSGRSFQFELSYSNLEADVTQAHIHFGQKGVNGGISVWLCSNLPMPPTPASFSRACPQSGTVTGTVTAADVVGPAGQGIAPGEFDELLQAMRAGVSYANVHSTKFPSGEIRGQIKGRSKNRGEDQSMNGGGANTSEAPAMDAGGEPEPAYMTHDH